MLPFRMSLAVTTATRVYAECSAHWSTIIEFRNTLHIFCSFTCPRRFFSGSEMFATHSLQAFYDFQRISFCDIKFNFMLEKIRKKLNQKTFLKNVWKMKTEIWNHFKCSIVCSSGIEHFELPIRQCDTFFGIKWVLRQRLTQVEMKNKIHFRL